MTAHYRRLLLGLALVCVPKLAAAQPAPAMAPINSDFSLTAGPYLFAGFGSRSTFFGVDNAVLSSVLNDGIGYGTALQLARRLEAHTLLEIEGAYNHFLLNYYEGLSGGVALRALTRRSWGVRVGVRYVHARSRSDLQDYSLQAISDALGTEPSVTTNTIVADTVGLHFGVGSRWRWGPALINLDLFDLFAPLVVVKSRSVLATRPNYTAQVETLSRSEALRRAHYELRLLQLSVGVNF